MNSTTRKTGSLAISAVLLTGAGVAAATVPATASGTQATNAAAAAQITMNSVGKSPVKSQTIVYRSAKATAKGSIAKVGKVAPTKKKVKKRYRSRRS